MKDVRELTNHFVLKDKLEEELEEDKKKLEKDVEEADKTMQYSLNECI